MNGARKLNYIIPEIARPGRTLHTWRAEFLAHFTHTDVSNGPTESLNLKIKNTKRTADSATSPTTGSAYFSTTAESRTITRQHGSEPAVSASWRRATKPLLNTNTCQPTTGNFGLTENRVRRICFVWLVRPGCGLI